MTLIALIYGAIVGFGAFWAETKDGMSAQARSRIDKKRMVDGMEIFLIDGVAGNGASSVFLRWKSEGEAVILPETGVARSECLLSQRVQGFCRWPWYRNGLCWKAADVSASSRSRLRQGRGRTRCGGI